MGWSRFRWCLLDCCRRCSSSANVINGRLVLVVEKANYRCVPCSLNVCFSICLNENSTQRHCAVVDSTLMGLQIYWNIIKHTSLLLPENWPWSVMNGALLWSSEQIFAFFSEESHRAMPCWKDIAGLLLLPPDFLTSLTSPWSTSFTRRKDR